MGGQQMVDVHGLGRGAIEAEQFSIAQTFGPVSVGIRPETMQILFDEDRDEEHMAEGEVAEVVYYGDMTYYEITLDGTEKPTTISMKNRVGRPVLEVGDRTRVAWDPRAVVIFDR